MSPSKVSVPKYRLHRGSGQAFVQVRGKRHYLGRHGTPQSKQRYAQFIAELSACSAVTPVAPTTHTTQVAVVELIDAYLQFAEGYYRKGGTPTKTLDNIRRSLRLANELYGRTPAADFGPLALMAIQSQLAGRHLSRRYVNDVVDKIRRMFKWGVSRQLIPEGSYHALSTVEGVKRGRSEARDPDPVPPVEDSVVEAVLPFMPKVVADMVLFQRLTGCRPGEVSQLRPMDIDRSREVWEYRPASHKTEHHGKARVIFIGPQAQAILLLYLLREATAYCFSPAESESKRHVGQRARRKTRVQPSQWNRRKSKRHRPPRDRYTKDSYNRAVQRACEVAFEMPKELRRVPKNPSAKELKRLAAMSAKERQQELDRFEADRRRRLYEAAQWRAKYCWSPNQLRHTRATEIRRQFGLEATQVVLGHSKADVTQVYAERDQTLAAEVMRKIG